MGKRSPLCRRGEGKFFHLFLWLLLLIMKTFICKARLWNFIIQHYKEKQWACRAQFYWQKWMKNEWCFTNTGELRSIQLYSFTHLTHFFFFSKKQHFEYFTADHYMCSDEERATHAGSGQKLRSQQRGLSSRTLGPMNPPRCPTSCFLGGHLMGTQECTVHTISSMCSADNNFDG